MSTGIPTTYRGIRFRSRLEARWAAFFDRLGWPWQYEPFDLPGYIPDFVVRLERDLLVEIKPAMALDDLRGPRSKIERSSWLGDALLVGATIWDVSHVRPAIGLFGEIGAECLDWSEARVVLCVSCGKLTPIPADSGWVCRACGEPLGPGDMGEARGLFELWADSGNRVQWRAA